MGEEKEKKIRKGGSQDAKDSTIIRLTLASISQMWAWCRALCQVLCLHYHRYDTAKQALSLVHRWENDDSARLSNWPVTRSETGKGEARLGTRVPLATENWFCPVLIWESADPSHRARRGTGSMNLTPTQRAAHWGPRAALGTSDMMGKLLVPFCWKRFSSLPPDSQRCVWIRNSKNKAEQPLRERFAERDFPTCKLFERQVIRELLAPGRRN